MKFGNKRQIIRGVISSIISIWLITFIWFISGLYKIKYSSFWFNLPISLIFYFLIYKKTYEIVKSDNPK